MTNPAPRTQYRRNFIRIYGFKALVACCVTFGVSVIVACALMKPSVGVDSIANHINPAFLQSVLNARLAGLTKDKIGAWLRAQSDSLLQNAEIISRDDFIRRQNAQNGNDDLWRPTPWRVHHDARGYTIEMPARPFSNQPFFGDEAADAGSETIAPLSAPRKRFPPGPPPPRPKLGFASFYDTVTYRQVVNYVRNYADHVHNTPLAADKSYYIIIPISRTPYAVLIQCSIRNIPYFRLSSALITIAVVILLLSLGAVGIIAPGIKRILRIEDACLKISRGDYAIRIADKHRDSIGLLARHINNMAEAIDKNFDRQKSLLQAVSHELRTPLARIRFKLEMLDIDEENEKNAERLSSIDEDFDEIDALLKELGYFNYLDAQKENTFIENADICALVGEALKQRSVALKNKDVKIIAPDGALMAQADPTAFKRAVGNLLSNAARYAQKNIEIRIRPALSGDAAEVTVEDDGPGIPPDKRQFVFEPFATIDKSRSKALGGVGLGLAIVRRIIAIHRGSIEIEDSALGGAKIVTVWPCIHHSENSSDNDIPSQPNA